MEPVPISRPWRLLRTVRPWACVLYLIIHVLCGWVTWAAISTVLLFPVWAKYWAQAERRVVVLIGRERLAEPPAIRGVSWRDITFALVTAALAPIGTLVALAVVLGVMSTLLAPLGVALSGPIQFGFGQVSEPIEQVAAVTLGLLLMPLALWALTVLATANARLSESVLSSPDEALRAQVKALASASVRTQDELLLERRLLQQQLHDGAQLQINVAGVRLGLLEYDIANSPPGHDRELLLSSIVAVRERLDAANDAIRDAAQGLVPRVLAEQGLGAALRAAAHAIPIPISVDCEIADMTVELETSFYLMASEALTNIVKHSGASTAAIRVAIEKEVVAMVISDDGVGGARATGGGILGMSARADRLGGTFLMDSPLGGPTTITARLPHRSVP